MELEYKFLSGTIRRIISEIEWEADLNRSLYLHTGDTLQNLLKPAVHEWFLQGLSIQQAIELWLVENPMV